jgi:hypothetical protein
MSFVETSQKDIDAHSLTTDTAVASRTNKSHSLSTLVSTGSPLHCNEKVHTHFVFDLNVHTPPIWGINLPVLLASLASLPSDSGPPVTSNVESANKKPRLPRKSRMKMNGSANSRLRRHKIALDFIPNPTTTMVVLVHQCNHHDSFDCGKSSGSDGSRSRVSERTTKASNRSPEGTVSAWESIVKYGSEVLGVESNVGSCFHDASTIDCAHAHI